MLPNKHLSSPNPAFSASFAQRNIRAITGFLGLEMALLNHSEISISNFPGFITI